MSKLKTGIQLFFFNLVVVSLVFLLCEGLAGTIFFVQKLRETKPVAERLHTRYDPELGWVNIPNTTIEDIYGPGLDVRINSQGFRNDQDFAVTPPPDKVRAICSGDSFTFSFGVSNEQTWCYRLSELEPRLQTVNMGQGGYGIDQAYLWYKRDGDKLAHDITLFAFITADFDRMQREIFLGYGKPVLRVEEGELILDNVPVPRTPYVVPWMTPAYQSAFNELRSVQLLGRLFFRPAPGEPPIDEPQIQEVAYRVLEEMQRLSRERGSRLVLVYLPTYGSYTPTIKEDTRRRYVAQGAAEKKIIFIDLVEQFRQIPDEEEVRQFFIPPGEIDFPGAAGHYSNKGNQYIAQRLYEELLARPDIIQMLDEARPGE